jgi:hypothetical protein
MPHKVEIPQHTAQTPRTLKKRSHHPVEFNDKNAFCMVWRAPSRPRRGFTTISV